MMYDEDDVDNDKVLVYSAAIGSHAIFWPAVYEQLCVRKGQPRASGYGPIMVASRDAIYQAKIYCPKPCGARALPIKPALVG